MRGIIPLTIFTVLFMLCGHVMGECANNCEWTSWFSWDCSRCCSTGPRFAIRQRGICCHNSTNPLVCLDRCSKQQIEMQETDTCPPHCESCPKTTAATTTVAALQTPANKYSQNTNQPSATQSQSSSTNNQRAVTSSTERATTNASTNNQLSDCQLASWSKWFCTYCQAHHFAVRQRGISCSNTQDLDVCLKHCDKQMTDLQERGDCASHGCPTSAPITKSQVSIETTSATTTVATMETATNTRSPKTSKPSTKVTQSSNNHISSPVTPSIGRLSTTDNPLPDCQLSAWSDWTCSYCQSDNVAVRQRGISCRNTNDLLVCLKQCGKKTSDIQEQGDCASHGCPSSTRITKPSVAIKTTTAGVTTVSKTSSRIQTRAQSKSTTARATKKIQTQAKSTTQKAQTTTNKKQTQTPAKSVTTSSVTKFTQLISSTGTSDITATLQTPPTSTQAATKTSSHSTMLQSASRMSKTDSTTSSPNSLLAASTSKTKPPTTSGHSGSVTTSTLISTKGRTKSSRQTSTNLKQTIFKSSTRYTNSQTRSKQTLSTPTSVQLTGSTSKKDKSGLKSPTTIVGHTASPSTVTPISFDGEIDSVDSIGVVLSAGFPSISTIISTALADTGSNSTEECRKKCAGKDTWDTCLKECFSHPCDNMLMLVSPCLFVLGCIVGTTITCVVRSVIKRLKKKKRKGEDNSVLPFKEYLD